MLRHIAGAGFTGRVFPVNPKYDLLDGIKTFHSLDQLPETPELAVICTPAATVSRIIGQLGDLGSKAAIVLSDTADFHDSLQQAALHAARPHMLRILGPGSAGIMTPAAWLNASLVAGGALPGRIALLAESGALACGLTDWASSQGIGFSKVVALGEVSTLTSATCWISWQAMSIRTRYYCARSISRMHESSCRRHVLPPATSRP
ncbi:succinyl-CoA ligase like flavodoxin domain protein [Collimonas arenae]|nr:succinyl-CoA ligase like flavodoxin domain protein [Collimonas arenae]